MGVDLDGQRLALAGLADHALFIGAFGGFSVDPLQPLLLHQPLTSAGPSAAPIVLEPWMRKAGP